MGIFDIFKKKKEGTATHENILEALLKKSATQPEYRAEFYEKLLTENIVVIGESDEKHEGVHTLKKDTKVHISSLSDGRIPFFTSIDRIFDKGIIKEKVSFLEMEGRNLFTVTKGATMLLNPYSDYGKEFIPSEVASMLDGTIWKQIGKNIEFHKNTPVQIGQPAKYPTEIVNALKQLFSNKPNVNAAYLGWIFYPESGEPAHYIFGIDADRDINSINSESGSAAKQFLRSDECVDFIKIDKPVGEMGKLEGLSNYFINQTQPFYKK